MVSCHHNHASYVDLNDQCEKASYNINKMLTQSHLHYWHQCIHTKKLLCSFLPKLTLKVHISPREYD